MKRKNGNYQPTPEHKFSFGLWTVGNRERDPFGDAVRESVSPEDLAALLAEVGAWGVNLHDNDLVPIDADIIPLGSTACQRRTEFHVFTSALAKGDSSPLNSRKNGAERHVAYKPVCNFFCYRNNLVSVWLESYPSPRLALQQQLAARLVGRI
jgi:hypothetical protein